MEPLLVFEDLGEHGDDVGNEQGEGKRCSVLVGLSVAQQRYRKRVSLQLDVLDIFAELEGVLQEYRPHGDLAILVALLVEPVYVFCDSRELRFQASSFGDKKRKLFYRDIFHDSHVLYASPGL